MNVLSFGEILWDKFPNEKKIGGAPLNFSAHMVKLGAQVSIVSAVGNDALGRQTMTALKKLGISREYVSKLPLQTGICKVSIDSDGTPSYEIIEGVAYDYITIQDFWLEHIKKEYHIFYFGTLSQRSHINRKSLEKIFTCCSFDEIFCDLNIRQYYYSADIIKSSLKHCTILKCSREESHVFAKLNIVSLQREYYIDETKYFSDLCSTLAGIYDMKVIIITLDKDGALLYSREKHQVILSPKPRNKALSTVGAGDSFSACFLYNYIRNVDLEECMNRAVLLSDFIVTKFDAVPEYPNDMLAKII